MRRPATVREVALFVEVMIERSSRSVVLTEDEIKEARTDRELWVDDLGDGGKPKLFYFPYEPGEEESLPTLMDLRGIAPNCTGDLSSEEFVRRSRDTWDD